VSAPAEDLRGLDPDGHGLERLCRWLDAVVPGGVDGPLQARLIAGGRSNPTYEIGDGVRRWVLRRPPLGHVLPTAHDMAREYRVITALRDTAVPVPRTVGICRDAEVVGAEFYVMDRLEGTTLRTREDTAGLTIEERAGLAETLVATLVALHAIDPREVGLAGWGRPDGYLARQLHRWGQQWEASATRERSEVAALLRRLGAALPSGGPAGIVHGDYKLDNVMVAPSEPTRVVGLLDWEMSTVGDPLTDLGILCSFWDHEDEVHNPITAGATALPGFPRREEIVVRYAEARGIEVARLDWYLVFADLKIAVILEGIHARHLQGHTAGQDLDDVGDMVEPLLARALEVAGASEDPLLRR
jgi:aminoglycoside phosphotransferase (APT) family kinase protein